MIWHLHNKRAGYPYHPRDGRVILSPVKAGNVSLGGSCAKYWARQ
jgi:hypothetical protein